MESIWEKLGTIIAALITLMGGFYMNDRRVTNRRLTKLEADSAQHALDIKVIETKFIELKSDTEEIKESQKTILALLTKRKR